MSVPGAVAPQRKKWYNIGDNTEQSSGGAMSMTAEEQIRAQLFAQQDVGYRDFHSRLMPTVEKSRVIGVRVPAVRRLARQLRGTAQEDAFLRSLPHEYYEENNVHAFLVAEIRDYDRCVQEIHRFLPYVDNWATCDGLRPKCFARHRAELWKEIPRWLASDHEYTVRFGLEMLMVHFLEEDFRPECLERAAAVRSADYYVQMMQAWLFAEALAKQYDAAAAYLEQRRLDKWVHNKTIQKAVESYRILPAQKAALRSMKKGVTSHK